jgi:5-methylcytosine-specific restriction endonuclease McrA
VLCDRRRGLCDSGRVSGCVRDVRVVRCQEFKQVPGDEGICQPSWIGAIEVASDPRYSTTRWRNYRKWYLADHPLCEECLKYGRDEGATDIDHVVPVNGPDDPSFWDEENHTALCHACHSRKTAREDGGFGNAMNDRPAQGADVNGIPTDTRHPWNR